MVNVVAVIGKKKSGKTTTAEFLVTHLAKEGFKIGCLKHVHHPNFTFDTKGKDTWRYSQAGAEIVVGVAANEVAVINKTKTIQEDFDQLLNLFKDKDLDFIVLEGFHMLVTGRKDVYKIITAKDEEGLSAILPGTSPPILAITGSITSKVAASERPGIPQIDIYANGDQLISIVRRLASKKSK